MLEVLASCILFGAIQAAALAWRAFRWLHGRLQGAPRRPANEEKQLAEELGQCPLPRHVAAVLPGGKVAPLHVAHLASLLLLVRKDFAPFLQPCHVFSSSSFFRILQTAQEAVTIHQDSGTMTEEADSIVLLLQTTFASSIANRVVHVLTFKGGERHEQIIGDAAQHQHHVTLQLISSEECAPDFVRAVQSVAESCALGEMTPADITRDDIVQRLAVQVSDPELVLCLDGPRRKGLLPWAIRFTEFLEAGRLEDFRVELLVSLVHRWAKVEQRYGR